MVTVLAFAFAISGMTREADREGQVAPEIERLDKTWFSNFSSNYGRKHNSSFVTMSWHSLSEELDVWFPFEASIQVRIYQ